MPRRVWGPGLVNMPCESVEQMLLDKVVDTGEDEVARVSVVARLRELKTTIGRVKTRLTAAVARPCARVLAGSARSALNEGCERRQPGESEGSMRRVT